MAKPKGPTRIPEIVWEDRINAVRLALEKGQCTYKAIANAIGKSIPFVQKLFDKFPEIRKEYLMTKRIIANQAADNIYDIVNDPDHPKNYDASKFIISRFKSDLDESCEKHDEEGLEVAINQGEIDEEAENKPSVVIRFRTKGE